MRKLRSRNKGFTLLEMLVTVAVVGILCVFLAGGLKTSLTKAKGVSCTSQLKQIGVLIMQYSAEHNNELPPSNAYFFNEQVDWSGAWFDPSTAEGGSGTGGLASYAEGKSLKELVICPARLPQATKAESPPIPEGFPYTANFHVLPTKGYNIVRTTSLDRPASIVLLADAGLVDGWKFGLNSYSPDVSGFVGSPHTDKHSNILWADGHVTSETIANLKKENISP
jgi:prepilin-type N-terminal cleavage/methylation domain-containing protein/prepilin-type processing-associated H-X9-DG protein